VKDRITIGSGSIVGAGAVVVHDLPAHVVAYGVPARVTRTLPQR
jgi:acetyltransferase-like isoleucine patch superfamily enzyme